MFSANNRGMITYMNKWLQDFFADRPKDMTGASWKGLVHADDYSLLFKNINEAVTKQIALNGQYRFLEKASGNYLWHLISVIPLKNDRDIINRWIGFIVDIHAQKNIEQTLKDNRELKETQKDLFDHQAQLQKKVLELNRSNYELEQFAHLASHDLQEPLRKLFFYSDVIKQKYSASIDGAGISMLNSMVKAAGRMKELIQDLLSFSQVQQQKLLMESVDLNEVIRELVRDLDLTIKERSKKKTQPLKYMSFRSFMEIYCA
jgi:PAS domain S-box-containing protein